MSKKSLWAVDSVFHLPDRQVKFLAGNVEDMHFTETLR